MTLSSELEASPTIATERVSLELAADVYPTGLNGALSRPPRTNVATVPLIDASANR